MPLTFIEHFLDFTKEMESPSSFFRWSAISTISAVLRDHVYVKQGDSKIYPNIFVILVAPSAEYRKSVPVGLAFKLLKEIKNTKIIHGRSSIEAVLDELASDSTSPTTGTIMAKGGSCILLAEELLSFFVSSDSLVPLLTDLYDFRETWESRLRGNGNGNNRFKISNLCLSMLAASNESHLREIYSGLAIHGGLLGRTFLIRPDEKRPPNALFDATEDEGDATRYDIKCMKNMLFEMAKLTGCPQISRPAALEYKRWYEDFRKQYAHKPDPSGILNRIHTGVKKIAIILGINDTMQLVIDKKHIEMAIDECTKILGNYGGFIMGVGKSTIMDAGQIVLSDIFHAKGHTITKQALLQAHWGEFDCETLDKILATFEAAGFIKLMQDGPKWNVFMLPDMVEKLNTQLGNIKKETVQ